MTSNVGSQTGDYEEAIRQSFKPEFINRLDDIVVFDRLDREQIGAIVDLQVARLVTRVAERGIAVELTDDARTLIGNLGYDPVYGARPLKRVIQKRLVDPLALRILDGDVRRRRHRRRRGAGRRARAAPGRRPQRSAGRRLRVS